MSRPTKAALESQIGCLNMAIDAFRKQRDHWIKVATENKALRAENENWREMADTLAGITGRAMAGKPVTAGEMSKAINKWSHLAKDAEK